MNEPLVKIRDLCVTYTIRAGDVHAVDEVSLDIQAGEVLGLVGESGCGKSTMGMALLRLVRHPGHIAGGEIWFDGRDLIQIGEEEMRQLRGARISMIFQDPMTSLNPLQRISDHVVETIITHRPEMSEEAAREKAAALIDRLGIMQERLDDYPHQLSGGMRQRVMIGLALSLQADLIVADEATTSLDVIVEAQFLDLLKELKDDLGLTILLITHNIGVVAQLADRVAVMYAAKLMELADVASLFGDPLHPYSQALLASVPNIRLSGDTLKIMQGSPPDLIAPPSGCRFHPRCPQAFDRCSAEEPPLVEARPGQHVACWLHSA